MRITFPLYSDISLLWFNADHKKIWAARRAMFQATR